MMLHNVTGLPVSFQEQRMYFFSAWDETMLCILSKDGCKMQSTLGKEWVEGILEYCSCLHSWIVLSSWSYAGAESY